MNGLSSSRKTNHMVLSGQTMKMVMNIFTDQKKSTVKTIYQRKDNGHLRKYC